MRPRGGCPAGRAVAWMMRLRELPGIDRALAALCVLVLLADCLWKGSAQAHPVLAIALSCAACVPLAWRSVAPLGSLAASMVGLIACAAVLDSADGDVAVALVPLYTVSALGGRRRSIAIAGLMTVVLAATTVQIEYPVDYRSGAVRLLLLFGALALGDIVRTRRALRAEAVARAAREERERGVRPPAQALARTSADRARTPRHDRTRARRDQRARRGRGTSRRSRRRRVRAGRHQERLR